MRKLILRSFQSPGDIVVMTAAVRDLHLAHPGQFQTDVRTAADAIWQHNPNITRLSETEPGVEIIDMHYPLIHQSNQRPYHFIHGYVQFLEDRLQVRIPVTRFQGDIHLSAEEKQLSLHTYAPDLREGFWIMMAGGKYDFTAKWWDPACFQKVVDHFQGRIQFVQCGEGGHWHPRLKGVVDLVGKTSTREFIRLMHHAAGVVCPVTFAMHLAAAVETRPGRPRCRPCVVIAGGREPPHWEAYSGHQFLHTIGALPCCAEGGCWRSRCQLVGDGDPKDRRELCEQPVQISDDLRIPRCMHMITAEDVIRRIELYVAPPQTEPQVGRIVYPAVFAPADGLTIRPTAQPPSTWDGFAIRPTIPARRQEKIQQKVSIRFRHGLGDAVQLTIVLKHLRHYHPDWLVDVAALPGRPSAFHGLCHQTRLLDQDRFDRFQYHQTLDLHWPECETGYADCPSTKASRCLIETFQLKPLPELCRYSIEVGEQAREHTARYLGTICQGDRRDDGRFPAVLIHYQGTTSAEYKDLPHDLAHRLCDIILDAGCVPVILDWHRRSPLIGRAGLHNPGCGHALWHGADTADADLLAALIDQSALMIGVDSGPLHVAGATTTPTLGVWTRHHPVHSFDLADNVLHLVPADHDKLLRGPAAADFFRQNYRFRTYETLDANLPAVVKTVLDGKPLYELANAPETNEGVQQHSLYELANASETNAEGVQQHTLYEVANAPETNAEGVQQHSPGLHGCNPGEESPLQAPTLKALDNNPHADTIRPINNRHADTIVPDRGRDTIVRNPRADALPDPDPADLPDLFARIGTPRLLVVGDLILDRYTWGDAERVSPEAPVLVLRADQEEVRLGGAASVAGLLRALDADVTLAGIIGDDAHGRILCKLLDDARIRRHAVLVDPGRPTTAKERFMGRAAHRHAQQILRVDREDLAPLPTDLERTLLSRIKQEIGRVQAVLVSDYAKGVCSPSFLAAVMAGAKRRQLPVLVDPARSPDFRRYQGAALLTPNRVEAALATGLEIRTPADAVKAAEKLRTDADVPAVLVKLDKDGMVLARQGAPGRLFPTRPRDVYDVTGAGDMVLAVCGLCRAAAIDWEPTVELANIAGGLEVERLGVAPVSRQEIKEELCSARCQRAPSRPRHAGSVPQNKVLALSDLADVVAALRRDGKKIVFTNGCFDLLHVGHVTYLQEAARLGDVLIVAINSDAGVRRLKGSGRPVIPEADRLALVAALECVDFALLFDEDTPHDLLRRLRPGVLVKGGTYALDEVVGKETVETYGGEVRVVAPVEGVSTTTVIMTLRKQLLVQSLAKE